MNNNTDIKRDSAGKIVGIVFLGIVSLFLVTAVLVFMIPTYNKDSKNNQKKVCWSNMRILKSNLDLYMRTGNNGNPFENIDDIDLNSPEFNELFDLGEVVKCTSGDNTVEYDIDIHDISSFTVKCQNPDCPNFGHSTDELNNDNN